MKIFNNSKIQIYNINKLLKKLRKIDISIQNKIKVKKIAL